MHNEACQSEEQENTWTTNKNTIPLDRSSLVCVIDTPTKGRGVFAKCPIAAKTLIEVSPILLVKANEYKEHTLQKTIFESYLFTWSRSSGDLALALGLGSLFNHDPEGPNVSYELDRTHQTIRYTTIRDIKEGEELCIYYGHGVHFGEEGELLVDLKKKYNNDEPPESEAQALIALSGLADSDDEEREASSSSTEDDEFDASAESETIKLADLPLQHVTRLVSAEDTPLELMEVYALQTKPRDAGQVFMFLQENNLDKIEETRHCRRVRRLNPETALVLLCPTSFMSLEEMTDLLSSHSDLSQSTPMVVHVPENPARTPVQLKEWSNSHWPISIVPIKEDVMAKERNESWSLGRLRWTKAMLAKVAGLAASGGDGDLPIGCLVTESWVPSRHSRENMPVFLACATDTRQSSGNPLQHSAMNVIKLVAALDIEKRRPIIENSDYLLTGLTVFMTHEPCLLCSMALLHSRIATLIYIKSSPGAGGCGTEYALHEQKGTNHKFEVWKVKDGQWDKLLRSVTNVRADP